MTGELVGLKTYVARHRRGSGGGHGGKENLRATKRMQVRLIQHVSIWVHTKKLTNSIDPYHM